MTLEPSQVASILRRAGRSYMTTTRFAELVIEFEQLFSQLDSEFNPIEFKAQCYAE